MPQASRKGASGEARTRSRSRSLCRLLVGYFGVFVVGRLVRLPAHPRAIHLDPERGGSEAQGGHADREARHHRGALG